MSEQSNLLAKYATENKDLRKKLKDAQREIAIYRGKSLTWTDQLWQLARERFNPEAEKLLAFVDSHLCSQLPIPTQFKTPFLPARELLRWIRSRAAQNPNPTDLFDQGIDVAQALLILGAVPAWPQASVVYQAAFEVNVSLWLDANNELEKEDDPAT